MGFLMPKAPAPPPPPPPPAPPPAYDDAERKEKHAVREEDIEKTNAHNRKNNRTPVVRVDSSK